MKIWNYIGEFFLFRWLLGKLHDMENGVSCGDLSSSFDYNKYDWDGQSYNDFHEEQDDYDMMDDF